MADIICPECRWGNDIDRWNRATKDYGLEHDVSGRYGGSWTDRAFVVCPHCENHIDLSDFETAVEDANEEDDW